MRCLRAAWVNRISTPLTTSCPLLRLAKIAQPAKCPTTGRAEPGHQGCGTSQSKEVEQLTLCCMAAA